jgi:NADH-quinone oxidoreductase subunit A
MLNSIFQFFKFFIANDTIFFVFFLFFSIFLSSLLAFISFLVSKHAPLYEKLSPYECGFEPFSDTRGRFNVHFAIVGILFLLLDIELIFILPWLMVAKSLGFFGFWSLYLFLTVLTLGFVYEWKSGVFNFFKD